MQTSIAQITSNVVSADSVTLSVDAETLETLNAAFESTCEWASAAFVKCDDQTAA